MATELTSAIVKEYGIKAGANVVGIAVSKDFGLAPDGFNINQEPLYVPRIETTDGQRII